jgi:hypothetical protein
LLRWLVASRLIAGSSGPAECRLAVNCIPGDAADIRASDTQFGQLVMAELAHFADKRLVAAPTPDPVARMFISVSCLFERVGRTAGKTEI